MATTPLSTIFILCASFAPINTINICTRYILVAQLCTPVIVVVVVVVVVVVFTSNCSSYPTTSAVPPASLLILHAGDFIKS